MSRRTKADLIRQQYASQRAAEDEAEDRRLTNEESWFLVGGILAGFGVVAGLLWSAGLI